MSYKLIASYSHLLEIEQWFGQVQNDIDAAQAAIDGTDPFSFFTLSQHQIVVFVLWENRAVLAKILSDNAQEIPVNPADVRRLFRLSDQTLEKLFGAYLVTQKVSFALFRDVLSRFSISAKSFGSETPWTHEMDAVVANLLGFHGSNAGEGGEPRERWQGFHNLRSAGSARDVFKPDCINTVVRLLSHHFSGQNAGAQNGISLDYLATLVWNNDKWDQGAKVGEGGLLGAKKNAGAFAYFRLGDKDVYAEQVLYSGQHCIYFRIKSSEGPADKKMAIIAMKNLGITTFNELEDKQYRVMPNGKIQVCDHDGDRPEGFQSFPAIFETRIFENPNFPAQSPPVFPDTKSVEDAGQKPSQKTAANPYVKPEGKLANRATLAAAVRAHMEFPGVRSVLFTGGAGGTGAAPKQSLDYAGTGLYNALVTGYSVMRNEWHGRADHILIAAEGGLRTSTDVLMAAALGAQVYGFGQFSLMAQDCVGVQDCHTGKCPKGLTGHKNKRHLYTATLQKTARAWMFLALATAKKVSLCGLTQMDDLIGTGSTYVHFESARLREQMKPVYGPDAKKGRQIQFTPLSNRRYPNEGSELPPFSDEMNFSGLEPMANGIAGPINSVSLTGIEKAKMTREQWFQDASMRAEAMRYKAMVGDQTELTIDDILIPMIRRGDREFTLYVTNQDLNFLERTQFWIQYFSSRGLIDPPSRENPFKFNTYGTLGNNALSYLTDGMVVHHKGNANHNVCNCMSGGEVVIDGAVGVTFGYGATGGLRIVIGYAAPRVATVQKSGVTLVMGNVGKYPGQNCCGGGLIVGGEISSIEPDDTVAPGMSGGYVILNTTCPMGTSPTNKPHSAKALSDDSQGLADYVLPLCYTDVGRERVGDILDTVRSSGNHRRITANNVAPIRKYDYVELADEPVLVGD